MSQYLKHLAKVDHRKITDLKEGDWLMIPDQMKKRADWPLAQIKECVVGSDGVVRTVLLQVKDKSYWRSVKGLIKVSVSGREENCNWSSMNGSYGMDGGTIST